MSKIVCVAVVKNEELYIAEWIAYQISIGFDSVIIMNNISTDHTIEVVEKFGHHFDVRVLTAPDIGETYQKSAYMTAIDTFKKEFDWMAFFDIDEFLVLDAPHNVKASLSEIHDAAAIGVNWASFGSSGHRTRPSGLVIENYQLRSFATFGPNGHVKSIVKPLAVRDFFNGHSFLVEGLYKNLSGQIIDWSSPGITKDSPDYKCGKLHHYFTKSWRDWNKKIERGYPDLDRKIQEFFIYDKNEVSDSSALVHKSSVLKILQQVGLQENKSHKKSLISKNDTAKIKTNKNKCAVVLIVKNEVTDIATWLAWYHILGFDTCIVFDDRSTDGTSETLKNAAKVQDVRLYTAFGNSHEIYESRQTVSYQFAINEFCDEFEWLAFFDADEFLALKQHKDIKSFLSRFSDADAVAINWCNYGSSGHVVKPDLLCLEAFAWHGNENQMVNRHVKSIIRPDKVGHQWKNVHCFDVPSDRYVLANGQKAEWGPIPGIITEDPDWSIAKIMHYQCRSMEQFVERVKNRPNFQATTALWFASDVRQVQDFLAIDQLLRVKKQVSVIKGEASRSNKLIFDVSRNMTATQSSISNWSYGQTPTEDAIRAITGRINGQAKFHTDLEDSPWWQVDFGWEFGISEVRIFNRMDQPGVAERASRLAIEIGLAPDHLVEVYRRETDAPFGGVDGKPLVFAPEIPIPGRFVRIRLLTRNYLHLDQVEVYGEPLPAFLQPGYQSEIAN